MVAETQDGSGGSREGDTTDIGERVTPEGQRSCVRVEVAGI